MIKLKIHIMVNKRVRYYTPLLFSNEMREYFDVTKGLEILGNPDIVWTQNITSKKLIKHIHRWAGPYVLHLAGDVWSELCNNGTSLNIVLDAIKKAKKNVCNSKFLFDMYSDRLGCGNFTYTPHGYWGLDQCYKGVNPSRFVKKECWKLHNPIKILCNINMDSKQKRKGMSYFLSIIKIYFGKYNIEVFCSGRSSVDIETNNFIKKIENEYLFFKYGYIGKNWIVDLSKFDLFVHPSMFDGWPRSVAECICVGLPVIAFDVGGTKEVSENVCLVKPNDVHLFIYYLNKMLQDEEYREGVGRMFIRESLTKTKKYRYDYTNLMLKIIKEI